MSVVRGGGGSGSINIPNDSFFATTIERDNFFQTNPSRLVVDAKCVINGDLQQYNGDSWVIVTPIVRGPAGQSAPSMLIQYSADGSAGWTEALNASIHRFWRWSIDGGLTWSPDNVKYTSDGAAITPYQSQSITDNSAKRHEHTNKAVLDNTTASFTSSEKNKLANLSERFRGVFADLEAANTAVPSPSGGMYFANSQTATLWNYNGSTGLWEDTGTNTAGDMLASTYDPQNIGQDVFERSNHSGTQPISTIADLSSTLQGKANWNGVSPSDDDVVAAIGTDGNFKPSTTAADKLVLLGGVTSDIQAQLNAKRNDADYPIGEVFCVGAIKIDSTPETPTAAAYGFKYSTVTLSNVSEVTSATDMDYITVNVSGYAPTGATLSALWLDISGDERDNIYSYKHTMTSSGTAGNIRVYSVDNSDWSGDNVMGHDDSVMWVKIWAVASA